MLEYPYCEELLQRLRANDETLVFLSITNIPRNEVNKLAPALRENTVLTSLNLHFNPVSILVMKQAKALALNTTLTSLNLRFNAIGPEGAKALARKTTLTSLDLRQRD